MRYTNIRVVSYQGHCILQLVIDGVEAEISEEQKPLLFKNGFLYIHPDKIWSELLPTLIITVGDKFTQNFTSLLRSKALLPLIFEMCNTIDFVSFNQKWVGKVIDEETETETRFHILDEL